MNRSASAWEESVLSLFRSAFLLPSLLVHGMLLVLALRTATLSLAKPELNPPISVQLMEINDGRSTDKSIGPGKGPGGPRALPKLGSPVAPAQPTGKLESGSLESSSPSNAVETIAPPKPMALPGPKILSNDLSRESVSLKETSPDSLVRLPTKEATTNLPTVMTVDP
jgi:hypothetical protein